MASSPSAVRRKLMRFQREKAAWYAYIGQLADLPRKNCNKEYLRRVSRAAKACVGALERADG